jgi:Trypsin-like peptidase domain
MIKCRVIGLIRFLIATALVSPANANDCGGKEANLEFGTWLSPGITLSKSVTLRKLDPASFGIQDTNSLRLDLSYPSRPSGWVITARDQDGRLLLTIRDSDLPHGVSTGQTQIWIARLSAQYLQLEISNLDDATVSVGIRTAIAYPVEHTDARLFSTKSAVPDWKDVYPSGSDTERHAADAVGMLVSGAANPQDGTRTAWSCSGVLIGENLFLTNWHCGGSSTEASEFVWNTDVVRNCLIDFAWDGRSTSDQFSCQRVVSLNEKLDYALIQIAPVIGGVGYFGLPAPGRIGQIVTPESVFVVHHALAGSKKVSDNCTVKSGPAVDGTRSLLHDCDTDPGSSGAPLFDSQGVIVGIHHLGFGSAQSCEGGAQTNKATYITDIISSVCAGNDPTIADLCRNRQ